MLQLTASSLPSIPIPNPNPNPNQYIYQIYKNPSISPTQLHALSLKTSTFNDPLISSRLISLYSHSPTTSLSHLLYIFNHIHHPTLFSYNTLIKSHLHHNLSQSSLTLFLHLLTHSPHAPDAFTLPCVITACGRLAALKEGEQIHALSLKLGFGSGSGSGSGSTSGSGSGSSTGSGSTSGSGSGSSTGSGSKSRSGPSSGSGSKSGSTSRSKSGSGSGSGSLSVSGSSSGSGSKSRSGPSSGSGSKSGSTSRSKPGSGSGSGSGSLSVSGSSSGSGSKSGSGSTSGSGFGSGSGSGFGSGSDKFVESSLVSMYAKCGDVGAARKVFDGMGEKDLVAWNALIDGYVKGGEVGVAYGLFEGMVERDVVTWTVMVDGLAKSGRVEEARKVFEEMPRRNVASWNAMINGYMKVGDVGEARGLFDGMGDRDVISWNSMIAGYERNGRCYEALKLFSVMLNSGCVPTHSTLVSTLSAVSWLALVNKGRWVHSYMVKNGHKLDGVLGTSLIEMYCKCGSIEAALKVFENIPNKKLGHWTAIVVGLGTHGKAKEALELFLKMLKFNVVPNAITFIGVLNACNHAGLVEDGRRYFDMMVNDYKIEPTVEHYGCLVDILCRAGRLDEAKNVIEKMPMKPNKIIWMSLLSASRIYKKVDIGEYAARKVAEIDPKFIESYVLLSNMYASTGNWDKVSHVRDTMRKTGVKKDPGCSLIEYKDEVHEFTVGDKSHPQTNEIYHKLSEIRERLKSVGHVPDKSQVLLHIEGDDEKETELESHSERLAISFGLINLNPGIPIRVVKNLRVCNDCHSVTKLLSEIYDREIIVRDNSRFHHFKNGSCSCMDYW